MPRTSFLEDVLQSAGQAELTELQKCIPVVEQKIIGLKFKLEEYIKSKYVDFDPLIRLNNNYADQANHLSNEMNSLHLRIEKQTKSDLTNSTGELNSLHESWKEHNVMLCVTRDLSVIDEGLKEAEKAQKTKRFVDAATKLKAVEGLIKHSTSHIDKLDLFSTLQRSSASAIESLWSETLENLNSLISWEEVDIPKDIKRTALKVFTSSSSLLEQVSKSMHIIDTLLPWISGFRKHFVRSVLTPIIDHVSSVNIVDHEDCSILEVEVSASSSKATYMTVLNNLTKCFEFLRDNLTVTYDDETTFISLLGAEISEDFCDSLIDNCLKDTIPSSSSKLEEYESVLRDAEEFHELILNIGFISTENKKIPEFIKNVDKLCADKTCRRKLEMAHLYIQESLHDKIHTDSLPLLEINEPATNVMDCISFKYPDSSILESDTYSPFQPDVKLHPKSFLFPSCYISKSAVKIRDLVRMVLEEAKQGSETSTILLLKTARQIFELYIAIAAEHHANNLHSIPEQVGLFHNNSMFLAHSLIVTGFEYSKVVKSKRILTFVDLVQKLRCLGTDAFLKHLQMQRKQLLNILGESGLKSLPEDPKLAPSSEKYLRQCLKQLSLLHNVWHKLLPKDVYNGAIGCLLNAVLEELVIRVCCLEDIPADTASSLTSMFSIVLEQAPQLYEDPSEVQIHAKLWRKFSELILVLKGSQRDIEDRWYDGKGPLAQEFNAEQVKRLVRALFQNSKRRADLLAKIR